MALNWGYPAESTVDFILEEMLMIRCHAITIDEYFLVMARHGFIYKYPHSDSTLLSELRNWVMFHIVTFIFHTWNFYSWHFKIRVSEHLSISYIMLDFSTLPIFTQLFNTQNELPHISTTIKLRSDIYNFHRAMISSQFPFQTKSSTLTTVMKLWYRNYIPEKICILQNHYQLFYFPRTAIILSK